MEHDDKIITIMPLDTLQFLAWAVVLNKTVNHVRNSNSRQAGSQSFDSIFHLGLGIDTDFTIQFDSDSQACDSIPLRLNSISIILDMFHYQIQHRANF